MQPLSSISTPYSSSSDVSDTSSSSSADSGSSTFSVPDYPITANKSYVSPEMTILDLRPRNAFVVSHLCGSMNIPLLPTCDSFFGNASAVEKRWLEMREAFEREDWALADSRKVLILCEDGDSGRMATAMLRAKGCEATCVEGGYPAVSEYLRAYER